MSAPTPSSRSLFPITSLLGPGVATPTAAEPPRPAETIPYGADGDAESPSKAKPLEPPVEDSDGTGETTTIWSLYGHNFAVPNDPKEMFLFLQSSFNDAYKAVGNDSPTVRHLALMHGDPIILSQLPLKRKATVIVNLTTGTPPAGEGSALQPSESSPASSFVKIEDDYEEGIHEAPSAVAVQPRVKRRRVPQSRFLGDFTTIGDLRARLGIGMSVARGKYIQGLASFNGQFADTVLMKPGCTNCEEYGRACSLLVGWSDDYVCASGCGACTQRGKHCTLKDMMR